MRPPFLRTGLTQRKSLNLTREPIQVSPMAMSACDLHKSAASAREPRRRTGAFCASSCSTSQRSCPHHRHRPSRRWVGKPALERLRPPDGRMPRLRSSTAPARASSLSPCSANKTGRTRESKNGLTEPGVSSGGRTRHRHARRDEGRRLVPGWHRRDPASGAHRLPPQRSARPLPAKHRRHCLEPRSLEDRSARGAARRSRAGTDQVSGLSRFRTMPRAGANGAARTAFMHPASRECRP